MKLIVLALIVCNVYLCWYTKYLHGLFKECIKLIDKDTKLIDRGFTLTEENIDMVYEILKKHLECQHGIITENKEKKNE